MIDFRRIKLLSYFVIFIAGFSFLVFEISWNRILSLFLGSTVFASTIVLATYMVGLGLGGVYWGRLISAGKASRHLLSLLFGGLAVVVLLTYYLFVDGMPFLYETLGQWPTAVRNIVVYLIAFVALLSSTFLMGGVLPAISAILIRTHKVVGVQMGAIYAVETLGSALGGLATGFLLLGSLGQFYTLTLGLLLLVGLAVLSRFFMSIPNLAKNIDNVHTKHQFTEGKRLAVYLTFVCGFVVIALQIGWIRILKVYLTNTSYTFALISSLVIVGIFMGSWYYNRRSRQRNANHKQVINLLLIMSVLTLLGVFVLLHASELVLIPLHEVFNSYFTRLLILPVIISIIVIIPVASLSGYAFPLAVDLYTKSVENISRNVGRIMLINAFGAFIGPLVMAFLLIPMVGAAKSLMALAVLLLVVAFMSNRQQTKPSSLISFVTLVGAGLLLLLIVSGMKLYVLPPSFQAENKNVVYYSESVQGTLVVGEARRGNSVVKSTYVDNASVIGSSYDAIKAVKMVGHMPFFAGLQCQDVLIVGFGIGVTTSAIAQHAEIENIDCVELIPDLKHASKFYKDLNGNILSDPRLTIHAGDGRHFLQSTGKMYDFISSDPTHPVLGSGSLYTREYFELYRKHLNPEGMVTQYLPLHKLNRNDLLGLIKTFHSVFPDMVVWLGHYHAVLMGSNQSIKIDFALWQERIAQLGKDMYFYANPYHLAATLIFDNKAIESFSDEMRINTDDKSYVEFFDFSVFRDENLPDNLAYLNFARDGVQCVFYNIPDEMMFKKFIEGNKIMTRGLEGMLRNNQELLKNQLRKAMLINPENEEYPFLLKLYFQPN